MVGIGKLVFSLSVAVVFLLSNCACELLIRKCCPEWQELNLRYNTCVDRPGYHGNRTSGNKESRRTAAEVRDDEGGADFPWWMYNGTAVLTADTLTPYTGFLSGQDSSKYIEFGAMPPCDHHMIYPVNSKRTVVRLLHNGSINYQQNNSNQTMTFSPTSYCVDVLRKNENITHTAYLICPCLEAPCIRKCCKQDRYISITNSRYEFKYDCRSTLDNNTTWKPRMYYDNLTEIEDQVVPPYFMFYSVQGGVCPDNQGAVAIEPGNSGFWRFPNGSVLTKEFGGGLPIEPKYTCGDLSVINDNKTLVENLFVCSERMQPVSPTATSKYYMSLFIVGLLFMLLTIAVFALVPEIKKANFNYIMCHICSQLPAYLVLALSHSFTVIPHVICIVLPFIIQFSFLAAFFWLNVMCIDISWAFSGIRPPQGSVTERDHKKFLYYSIYAWGSPTMITIVTAIMEFDESIPNTFVKPNFGVAACWFEEKIAAFAYFYGPMAVLLVANFALFIYTTIKIIKVQRDTRILRNGESGRHDGSSNFKKDKKRLILYAKLFCLMGLTWVTEIISWLHGSAQYYWYITDAINLLRAVFIFIIFCCKRKVFRLLKQRLFPSLASKNNASQSNGTRKSSSSTQQSSLQSMQMAQINGNSKGNSANTGNP